jgi:hypothetical protein
MEFTFTCFVGVVVGPPHSGRKTFKQQLDARFGRRTYHWSPDLFLSRSTCRLRYIYVLHGSSFEFLEKDVGPWVEKFSGMPVAVFASQVYENLQKTDPYDVLEVDLIEQGMQIMRAVDLPNITARIGQRRMPFQPLPGTL